QALKAGELVVNPGNASRIGHSFTGWYTAATGGTHWNFATDTVTEANMTLYAQYSVNQYTINFDINGGRSISAITRAYGANVALPTSDREEYDFNGWYYNGRTVNGSMRMGANDVTLRAVWSPTIKEATINFDSNGGSAVSSITANVGSQVDLANSLPEKFAYKFLGWYVGDTLYSGSISMPENGLNLTAKWQDYVSAGIWTIDADDISVDINDLKGWIETGVTAERILGLANAEARNVETDTELSPLSILNIEVLDVLENGDYEMVVAYKQSRVTNEDGETVYLLQDNFTVKVTGELDRIVEADAFGWMMPWGLLALAIATLFFLIILWRRRKDEEEEELEENAA
ncbi:MAG: InlB B-repeat-containing protein, partial [Erysipelotrichaceae bacterium]